ncbi:MAG: hypothetical protein EXR62_07825 [Chloroflexi bacterium]|nr:hypothetical protein [Chloroflexota bacterium]
MATTEVPLLVDEQVDLTVYLQALRRYWWLALGLSVVFALAAALVSFLVLPPIYEARAGVVHLGAQTELNFDPKFKTTTSGDVNSRRQSLVTLSTSSIVVAEIIKTLGGQLPEKLRDIQALQGTMKTVVSGDLLELTVQYSDPRVAMAIANAWAKDFETSVNQTYARGREDLPNVEQQATQARQNYLAAEEALINFTRTSQVEQLKQRVKTQQEVLADTGATLRAIDRLVADTRALHQQVATAPSAAEVTQISNNLSTLLLRAQAYTNLIQSNNPATAQTGPFLLQIDPAKLRTQPLELAQDLDGLIVIFEQRRTALQDTLAKGDDWQSLSQLQAELEGQTSRQNQLTQARDLAWDTYNTVSRKVEEVKVANNVSSDEVRLALEATAPSKPIGPRKGLNIIAGAASGLVLGVLAAFVLSATSGMKY